MEKNSKSSPWSQPPEIIIYTWVQELANMSVKGQTVSVLTLQPHVSAVATCSAIIAQNHPEMTEEMGVATFQ